ncbi:molybdenum cofactor biosynthesis protein, partial [Salmonella enterica subsp. enterica serovar Infantis]
MSQVSAEVIPPRIAIRTVSSRRGEADDPSGHDLRASAQAAGREVVARAMVTEKRSAIRAPVAAWSAWDAGRGGVG